MLTDRTTRISRILAKSLCGAGKNSLPWKANGIAKHPYIDSPAVMLDISKIKPEHGRNTRPSKPIVPGEPYTPLVVDTKGVLQDGYHRYYDLIDQGYTGKVPVVVYQ